MSQNYQWNSQKNDCQSVQNNQSVIDQTSSEILQSKFIQSKEFGGHRPETHVKFILPQMDKTNKSILKLFLIFLRVWFQGKYKRVLPVLSRIQKGCVKRIVILIENVRPGKFQINIKILKGPWINSHILDKPGYAVLFIK